MKMTDLASCLSGVPKTKSAGAASHARSCFRSAFGLPLMAPFNVCCFPAKYTVKGYSLVASGLSCAFNLNECNSAGVVPTVVRAGVSRSSNVLPVVPSGKFRVCMGLTVTVSSVVQASALSNLYRYLPTTNAKVACL